jgi:hypothetical protein
MNDEKILEIKELIEKGKALEFIEDEQGAVRFKKRFSVPDIKSIRELILREAHDSAYSIHPGSMKMYHDLKSH